MPDQGHGVLEFDNWRPLRQLTVGDLPRDGAIAAVYAMSSANGDILYIGSTDNLRRRIFGNYIGGVGGLTTERIHTLLFSEGKIAEVEVAWLESPAWQEKEAVLKDLYRAMHGRLPAWNRR